MLPANLDFSKDISVTFQQRDIIQDIFKTTSTIILVIHPYLPQETLKQLDMDYRRSLTWV